MASFFQKISVIVSTGFGIGYLTPIGQGSLAALAAIFLVRPFLSLSLLSQSFLILGCLIIGVVASSVAEKKFDKKDDHRIVIDEIISIFITFWGFESGISVAVLASGFILNRLLDIWKPFFISRLQNIHGGWGIMLDDAASAVISNIVLRMILLI